MRPTLDSVTAVHSQAKMRAAIAITGLMLLFAPLSAEAQSVQPTWSIDVRAGVLGAMTVPASARLQFEPIGIFAVSHRMSRHVSFVASAGYVRPEAMNSLVRIPEVTVTEASAHASLTPLALGVRVGFLDRRGPVTPYLEVAPALFLYRESKRFAGYGFGRGAFANSESFQSLERGFEAGLFVPGKIGHSFEWELGALYLFSGHTAERFSPASNLSHLAWLGGIRFRP